MTFNSFDAVFFTAAFLVPGFVWESVLHMFLRRREDRADRVWVRLLTLSALNYGFLSWLVYLLLAQVGVLARPWVAALAWFFIVLAGVFSARSFASSEPSHRDLYLEQIYEIEDDGPWQPVPMNRGVWIRGEAIRTIELLAFQE